MNNRLCISLSALYGIPGDRTHAVHVVDYQVFPALNPSGAARPNRIVSSAVLTVGGAYRVQARIVWGHAGTSLELNRNAFDMTRLRPETLTLTAGLVRSMFDVMAASHVLAQARQHGRGVGRN